jgi:hypothetical protein
MELAKPNNVDQLILINFKAPERLKNTFDSLCRYQRTTRTRMLLDLMDGYICSHGSHPAVDVEPLKLTEKSIRSRIRGLIPRIVRSPFKSEDRTIKSQSGDIGR